MLNGESRAPMNAQSGGSQDARRKGDDLCRDVRPEIVKASRLFDACHFPEAGDLMSQSRCKQNSS